MISCVYADPPWSFNMKVTGGSFKSGADQKYPTMDLNDIVDLPVASLLAPNATLWLWVPTALKFSHAPRVWQGWGFTAYRTTVYWHKQRLGMGANFRNIVEELIICTRGDVAPFRLTDTANYLSLPLTGVEGDFEDVQDGIHLSAPAEGHSRKPEAFRKLIERAVGEASSKRYVELFARREAPGWRCLGNGVQQGIQIVDAIEAVTLELRQSKSRS